MGPFEGVPSRERRWGGHHEDTDGAEAARADSIAYVWERASIVGLERRSSYRSLLINIIGLCVIIHEQGRCIKAPGDVFTVSSFWWLRDHQRPGG